jgi:hypothetical protein
MQTEYISTIPTGIRRQTIASYNVWSRIITPSESLRFSVSEPPDVSFARSTSNGPGPTTSRRLLASFDSSDVTGETTQVPSRKEPSDFLADPARVPNPRLALSALGGRNLEAMDADSPVGVLGSRAAGDAQLAGGEIFDQEGQQSSFLAYNGDEPPELLAIRTPPPALGWTVHLEAPRPEFLYVRPEVVGGGAVVDEATTRGEEAPPAPDVVTGVFPVYESNELEVGAVPERYEGVAGEAVGVLAARRYREAQSLVAAGRPVEVLRQDHQVVQTPQHAASANMRPSTSAVV